MCMCAQFTSLAANAALQKQVLNWSHPLPLPFPFSMSSAAATEGSLTTEPDVWPTSKAEKDSFVNLSVLGGTN